MAAKELRNVRMRKGALAGWHHDEPASVRHAAIRRRVRRTGLSSTVDALNILGTRSKNRTPATAEIAERDVRWISTNLEVGRRQRRSKPIRVRRSQRARAHRRRRRR